MSEIASIKMKDGKTLFLYSPSALSFFQIFPVFSKFDKGEVIRDEDFAKMMEVIFMNSFIRTAEGKEIKLDSYMIIKDNLSEDFRLFNTVMEKIGESVINEMSSNA